MKRCLLFALLFTVSLASPALSDKRVALVIGNSAYQNVAPLDNPANDAALMAQTLKNLGFSLTGNSAQLNLDEAVQAFGRQVQGADVAMFYYAGHGVQVRGSNFLVPVKANPTREADVDFSDGRRQGRAQSKPGLGHTAQHHHPGCLSQKSIGGSRPSFLGKWACADPRTRRHADFICHAAGQRSAGRR
jgi:hypothetical protein